MANRDPAMLFYTSDFLTGVALLNMKERGQYITLLCLQQQHGHMCRRDMEKVVGKLSDTLLEKFSSDEQGRLYNVRAQTEIEKRSAHCQLQQEKIKKRWANTGTTAELPLEAVNGNENENEPKDHMGELEGVVSAYRRSIESDPPPQRVEALRSYCASLSPAAVSHAIEVAADNNKKSWSYIKAILLRYTAQGIVTIEDIDRDERKRSIAPRGGTSPALPTALPDFATLQSLTDRI